MSVLVIAEHDNKNLKSSTLNTISAAEKLSEDIHLLILGNKIEDLAKSSKSIQLVKKVIICDHEKLENQIPELSSPIISNLAENYSHILAPSSTFGKNLLPRVSAQLDVTQISDIIGIESQDTFIRPIYAGNAISYVQTDQKINLMTVRPTSFEKCEETGGDAAVENISFIDSEVKTTFVSLSLIHI